MPIHSLLPSSCVNSTRRISSSPLDWAAVIGNSTVPESELSGWRWTSIAPLPTSAALSAAVALTARDQTALIGISTLVVLPATFLSTALMPVALLPHWVEATARYNPLTWATELARTAMSPSVDGRVVLTRGLLLLALSAVTYAWSVAAMRNYQRSL